MSLRLLPWSYAGFGASVMFAQQPDIPVTTAATALIGGFTLLLGTLVWVVKKGIDTNAAQEKERAAERAAEREERAAEREERTKERAAEQQAFAAALEKQNMVFAVVLDKVREDGKATLKLITEQRDG